MTASSQWAGSSVNKLFSLQLLISPGGPQTPKDHRSTAPDAECLNPKIYSRELI